MLTINEARDIVLNFKFFGSEFYSLEIILRFIISKLSRLVSQIRKKLMGLIIKYQFFQKIQIKKICYFTELKIINLQWSYKNPKLKLQVVKDLLPLLYRFSIFLLSIPIKSTPSILGCDFATNWAVSRVCHGHTILFYLPTEKIIEFSSLGPGGSARRD